MFRPWGHTPLRRPSRTPGKQSSRLSLCLSLSWSGDRGRWREAGGGRGRREAPQTGCSLGWRACHNRTHGVGRWGMQASGKGDTAGYRQASLQACQAGHSLNGWGGSGCGPSKQEGSWCSLPAWQTKSPPLTAPVLGRLQGQLLLEPPHALLGPACRCPCTHPCPRRHWCPRRQPRRSRTCCLWHCLWRGLRRWRRLLLRLLAAPGPGQQPLLPPPHHAQRAPVWPPSPPLSPALLYSLGTGSSAGACKRAGGGVGWGGGLGAWRELVSTGCLRVNGARLRVQGRAAAAGTGGSAPQRGRRQLHAQGGPCCPAGMHCQEVGCQLFDVFGTSPQGGHLQRAGQRGAGCIYGMDRRVRPLMPGWSSPAGS